MSDLHEALARQLAKVAKDNMYDWQPHESLFALADECIRQMEWARQRCSNVDMTKGERIDPSDEHRAAKAAGENVCLHSYWHYPLVPLTLAPDDWKPHE